MKLSFCTAGGVARFLTLPGSGADSEFLEHDLQRAEVRDGRLEQIEAHKSREPKPVRAVVVGQDKAQKDERAGKPADKEMHFHKVWLLPSR